MEFKQGTIVEFKLEDFGYDLVQAFDIIVALYDRALKNDPEWHYFNEGDYAFIRCAYRWAEVIKPILKQYDVEFAWPPKEWVEPYPLTQEFQTEFKDVFHSLSVLVIQLYKNKKNAREYVDNYFIKAAADRVIHPFLNMATYICGSEDKEIVATNWEAEMMAELTVSRAYISGMICGEQRMKRIMESRRKADQRDAQK